MNDFHFFGVGGIKSYKGEADCESAVNCKADCDAPLSHGANTEATEAVNI